MRYPYPSYRIAHAELVKAAKALGHTLTPVQDVWVWFSTQNADLVFYCKKCSEEAFVSVEAQAFGRAAGYTMATTMQTPCRADHPYKPD